MHGCIRVATGRPVLTGCLSFIGIGRIHDHFLSSPRSTKEREPVQIGRPVATLGCTIFTDTVDSSLSSYGFGFGERTNYGEEK